MKLTITYEHDVPINAFQWTPKTYRQPLHAHSSLEMGLCLSGTGTFFFGSKQYQVRQGDVFLVNNEELHIAQSDPNDPSHYLFLNFDGALLMSEDPSLLLPYSYRSANFNNLIPAGSPLAEAVIPWMTAVERELRDREPGYMAMAKSALIQLSGLLLRHYHAGLTDSEQRSMVQSVTQTKALAELVEQRYREPIGLQDIAKELGISVSRASRVFHETTGRRFADYVSLLRVQEAKRLLAGSDRQVAHIGFECGFQSLATFYRVFKESTGVSPVHFRQTLGLEAPG
ncbi:AraC family transcriptional regulator [Paenibacillus sacheonensis]|uniref:Helix-turn-helix domain-containing protein n=1 Tax=Paenibacillus sacheonensis TaxID=742054 RepID=A0A7X4YP93_9BACL|nr:AraC family transcriptional regulator [Paenibacillus sacheonensis]MBM7565221.1 AraC-like DNA-binding protein [Paenibacillus sacheonensis]NBC70003.1 helix-turn-helix domain-containing protein [Paenibacillus sacheonensis]